MLVKIHDGTDTLVVKDPDTLIKIIRAGKVNKDTRVYDGDAGEYSKLEEVEAVKEMAINNNYNQYLCMNTQNIYLQKSKENASKTQYKIFISASLIILIIGLILKVISLTRVITSFNFISGQLLGSQLGGTLFSILIWLVILTWYRKKRKIIAGIILVLKSTLFLLIEFITFIVSFFLSYINLI